MHGGPVLLDGASSALPEVPQDTVETFLKAMLNKYGSCVVLVIARANDTKHSGFVSQRRLRTPR
jgi:hypothetical protein